MRAVSAGGGELLRVRLIESHFTWQLGGPLPEEHSEGNVVEDNTDVEGTDEHVDCTGELVEAGSLLEVNVVSGKLSSWWLVHDGLECVSLKGLEVHLADLDDDLESHEVTDAVLNSVLVGQKVNVDDLADDGAEDLVEAEEPADLGAIALEEVSLLIREFHNVESLGDLWVQHKVKGDGAWEFNVEHSERVTELVIVPAVLVVCNGTVHAEKHKVNDCLHGQR